MRLPPQPYMMTRPTTGRRVDQYERDFFLESSGDDSTEVDDDKRARLSDLGDAVVLGSNILNQAGFQLVLDRPGEWEPDKKLAGTVETYLRAAFQHAQRRGGVDIKGRASKWTL